MTAIEKINLDLTLTVGDGATVRVGSDCYPYYVSETLPNGVYGLYSPNAKFDDAHPWEGGTQVVDPFDPGHPSDFYVKHRYGNWWKVKADGTPIQRYSTRYHSLTFGSAYAYLNPSF